MSPRTKTLKSNRDKRNTRLKSEFKKRYTDAQRPRKYSREYVISQLAEEYCLSMHTVEDIIYKAEPVSDKVQ